MQIAIFPTVLMDDHLHRSEDAILLMKKPLPVIWQLNMVAIMDVRRGVEQEGTSLGDYLGPKSEAERFCVESMINKYLVAVIFTSDKQGRRNDMLKDGPGAQSRL